jgi:hypothetical protein
MMTGAQASAAWRKMIDHVCMSLVIDRALSDPATFLERAARRVSDLEHGQRLLMAAHYAHAGKDVPQWLFS